MGGVSNILKDEWIDRAIAQLDDEKSFGIMLSEFSRTVIDRPDTHIKIANSYAGHAAQLQITCVLRELRLWCCRIWDSNGHSLRQLAPRLVSAKGNIVLARRRAYPDWPEEQLGCEMLPNRITEFKNSVESISNSSLIAELKLSRDEHFAHLTKGVSGIRRQLSQTGAGSNGYSYNEVLELVDRSVSLIAEAISIWRFEVHSDEDSARIFRSYSEQYWSVMPNFSEIERALSDAGNLK